MVGHDEVPYILDFLPLEDPDQTRISKANAQAYWWFMNGGDTMNMRVNAPAC